MQDGAHFTAMQLVRAGIYNYLKSRSVLVVTLYIYILYAYIYAYTANNLNLNSKYIANCCGI
jgi:hypothetical protein